MKAVEMQLRTVAMGGYAKEDVQRYIENMERDYQERRESMEKILAAAQRARSEAEMKLSSHQFSQTHNSEEVQELRVRAAELEAKVNELQAQLVAKDTELRAALSELEQALATGDGSAAAAELASAHLEIAALKDKITRLQEEQGSSEELELLRTKLSEQEMILPVLNQENLALKAKVAMLEGAGKEKLEALQHELDAARTTISQYETAGLNLQQVEAQSHALEEAAQRRAKELLRDAEADASRLRAEADTWLLGVQRNYEHVKQGTLESVRRAADEISRLQGLLCQLEEGKDENMPDFNQAHAASSKIVQMGSYEKQRGVQ